MERPSFIVSFVCVDAIIHPSRQLFKHVGMFSGLPGLNHYLKQRIKCLAQGHNPVSPVSLELHCVVTL